MGPRHDSFCIPHPVPWFSFAAKSETQCLDLWVLCEEGAVSVCGQRTMGESKKFILLERETTFLSHNVGFAAPDGTFGGSEAEVCPVSSHTQAPREPLKSENCISGRNTTNSWEAQHLYADVTSFCTS